MKHRYLLTALLTLILAAAVPLIAFANPVPPYVWHDDMEGDTSDWATADFTATAVPHFHWDTYMAYDGASWWCGSFDYDADGGYGNSWDDRLELKVEFVPVEHVSWGSLKALYRDRPSDDERSGDPVGPVLTFAHRHDSEIGYDRTYVQAESSGVYLNLNQGYEGRQAWTDIGPYGFELAKYDDPLKVRFRFVSDGAWSDEDGDYLSVGGGFAVDNIKIYDFETGVILFYDSEPGLREDECVPAIPGAAGDYWHLIDRACPAYSDPHSWWCGDDADTSLVPPNLQNGLFSPIIDVGYAYSCTTYFAMHFAVPTVDNDYVAILGTVGDGYYGVASYWGDMESCSGWGNTPFNVGFDIGQFGSGVISEAGVLFVMNTTDNGCGPAVAGDAGVMLDDLWICTDGGIPWEEGERTTDLYYAERRRSTAKSIHVPAQVLRR